MKLAIVGYGRMGKELEQIAGARGHEVHAIIDEKNKSDLGNLDGESIDIAFEFTNAQVASNNVRMLIARGIPVVSGTTGWNPELEKLKSDIEGLGGTLFHASNFSLGVNIVKEAVRRLAELISVDAGYFTTIRESHHVHKKDAPSGTAITLAETIIENSKNVNAWKMNQENQRTSNTILIKSIREGEIPGTHEIKFESENDTIQLIHTAKDRSIFAKGAMLVAEWLPGKHGFQTMSDFLDL